MYSLLMSIHSRDLPLINCDRILENGSTSLGITGELYSSSMAVVDGPFNFMGYTDNGESPPTDSDQPCSSSSYKPTPTSVSTEAVTLINNSTEGPKAKKTRVTKKVTMLPMLPSLHMLPMLLFNHVLIVTHVTSVTFVS